MTKKIAPKKEKFIAKFDYNDGIVASKACGAEFKTGSTKDALRVDICASCHPFFTGDSKIVDADLDESLSLIKNTHSLINKWRR